MIMKYATKKPVIIEAVQWDGLNLEEIKTFVGKSSMNYSIDDAAWKVGKAPPHVTLIIKIAEGDHYCTVGDFIIKDENGVFNILSPDIFNKTYEPVDSVTITCGNKIFRNVRNVEGTYVKKN